MTASTTTNDLGIHFPSLDALRAAHGALLKQRRDGGGAPESISSQCVADIDDFIRRGQGTGALLDSEGDRQEAQSFLDYWATFSFRLGHEPPDPTLAEFDPS